MGHEIQCVEVQCSSRHKLTRTHIIFYHLNNPVLQHVEAAKYIGIYIQSSLGFDRHIQDVTAKANSRLGFLKRNLKGVPSSIERTAYISLVRSGLEYGAVVWDPHTQVQKKKLELVQNRAMRWINNLPPFDYCS